LVRIHLIQLDGRVRLFRPIVAHGATIDRITPRAGGSARARCAR
jgi:hypothetical protein